MKDKPVTNRYDLFILYDNKNLPVELVPFNFPTEMVNSDKCRFIRNMYKTFIKLYY